MLISFAISEEMMEFRICVLGGCPEYTKLCVSEHLIPYHFALIRKLKKNQLTNVNASSFLEMSYLLSGS